MTPLELRSSFAMAAVSGLRLLGLFIVLPVFALYAEGLPGGGNKALLGIALGAYGITQALLQVPFGWLSDHWGRKQSIYLGLVVFAAGSFVAALATSLEMVILGRVIQGAGAVSGAVAALTADLTRDEVRTKAMAIIGITIGVSFTVSIVLGPVLGRWIGVPGIFALTGVLALSGIALVALAVPDPPAVRRDDHTDIRLGSVLLHPQLLRLNAGIFALHAVLMALFVVVPLELRSAGLPGDDHWRVYLPVVLAGFVLMLPMIMVSERRNLQKRAFLAAIALLAAAFGVLAFAGQRLAGIAGGLALFFTAFNFLEASLPSLVSKTAPASAKGKALGAYSSIQFIGTFVGAAAGGVLSQHFGPGAVFLACAGLVLVWGSAALGMQVPVVRTYPVPPMDAVRLDGLVRQLRRLPGVHEANLVPAESVARLKVDRARFDEQNVIRILQGET